MLALTESQNYTVVQKIIASERITNKVSSNCQVAKTLESNIASAGARLNITGLHIRCSWQVLPHG